MSRPVYIAGVGIVDVTKRKGATIASMARKAVLEALDDSGVPAGERRRVVDALYVGNMMSGMLSKQQHLGPLVATEAGLAGVDAITIESCSGAGASALRVGVIALQSGLVDTVVVCGVEQMSHADLQTTTEALATASHWENEGAKGETFASLNGHLATAYFERYNLKPEDLADFSVNAHSNALHARHSLFKKHVTAAEYADSRVITGPIRLMDACPICDGSAAIVLTTNRGMLRKDRSRVVEIAGTACATDILTVNDREDPLALEAAKQSTIRALGMAGLQRADIDLFELHDAYSIIACLGLEAAGFCEPGEGHLFAKQGRIALGGDLPISTFGGLKARGHPVGATGVYQAAEVFLQLSRRAGENQVENAEVAVSQNIGGAGSSVFTHCYTSSSA
eukprot:gene5729-8757_t